eukprot:1134208-Pelagomonas_calceolata.AAC.1
MQQHIDCALPLDFRLQAAHVPSQGLQALATQESLMQRTGAVRVNYMSQQHLVNLEHTPKPPDAGAENVPPRGNLPQLA